MNQCKLEIFFRFVDVRDEYMGVTVSYNDSQSTLSPTDDSTYCYVQDITLPAKIELNFFGKNKDRDTQIDEHGNIIRDKHVMIKEIKLDNIPVELLYLKRRLGLEHENGTNYSNYIGFNGSMTINFECSNVFNQIQTFKRLGEY